MPQPLKLGVFLEIDLPKNIIEMGGAQHTIRYHRYFLETRSERR
jgi:hypothetical protein